MTTCCWAMSSSTSRPTRLPSDSTTTSRPSCVRRLCGSTPNRSQSFATGRNSSRSRTTSSVVPIVFSRSPDAWMVLDDGQERDHVGLAPHAHQLARSNIARVSGRRMRTTLPAPFVELNCTWPPRSTMLRLTTSIPTPRPDKSLTAAAVEKPGRNTRLKICSSDNGCPSFSKPCARAFSNIFARSRPAPSSRTSMMTAAALVESAQLHTALPRSCRRPAGPRGSPAHDPTHCGSDGPTDR